MGEAGSDVDCYIGQRLRQQRQLHGLLEPQLAARLGINVSQLLLFEDGRKRIPAPLLIKAAELFRVSVGWFFESAPAFAPVDGLMPSMPTLPAFSALPEAYPLMKAFLSLGSAAAREAAVARLGLSLPDAKLDEVKRVRSTMARRLATKPWRSPANDPQGASAESWQNDPQPKTQG